MNIYVVEIDGRFEVSFTGLETVEEVQAALWEGERLVHFYKDTNYYSNPEVNQAAEVIDALTCLDSTREVLERLLTVVYRLGR